MQMMLWSKAQIAGILGPGTGMCRRVAENCVTKDIQGKVSFGARHGKGL